MKDALRHQGIVLTGIQFHAVIGAVIYTLSRFHAGALQGLFGAYLVMQDVPMGPDIRVALIQAQTSVVWVGGSAEGFLPVLNTLLPNTESAMLRSVMAYAATEGARERARIPKLPRIVRHSEVQRK